MSGASRLIKKLVARGVTTIFGYGGGAILPVLDALAVNGSIKYYLSRTEQGGGFMADGYANVTGTTGVVMTTSGPGALNTITCLQNALSDGTPLLALTGQVSTAVLGTDAFQEADVIAISKPCTKWNTMVVGDIEACVDEAMDISMSGRRGPVLLDLPKNVMAGVAAVAAVNKKQHTMLKQKQSTVDGDDITQMILAAKRPVILAGKGVLQAGPRAISNLRMLSMIYNIPVTTTLLGLGVYNEQSPLSLKMIGMHGSYYANMAVQNCDLLLNFGSRFDDRITGDVTQFARGAKIVHVDICADNINKVIKTPYFINDSCEPILQYLVTNGVSGIRNNEWLGVIASWKKTGFSYTEGGGVLQGRSVIAQLNKLLWLSTKRYTIVADVGAHQMWAAQFIDYNYGRVRFLTSGGLGTMGYAVPAAIGAAIGSNDCVICICGDGGFTMSFVELLTAVENKVNVKVLVINNSYQLMVKMWQEKFYEGRLMGVKMNNPPFELVCRELGCETMRIEWGDDVELKLQQFLNYVGGPIVANVITSSSEPVLPMVSPGKALDNMILEDTVGKLDGEAPC
jgi:acetolactate synthase-1/2/3 large subunit